MFKKYIEYYKHNPEGYWFKRKLFGWGWMPVKWQGWLVVAIAVMVVIVGVYVGEADDVPGVALLGIIVAAALIFGFGYWRGEKPRWQWGLPIYQCPECKLHYTERAWAEKCEAWCREHHSCHLEITAHAEENKKL